MNSRLTACYRVRAEADAIEDRARGLAVEQSVEMPVGAIREAAIREEIVGRVARIEDRGDGWFDVDVALASATVGDDAGQLLNMLYGNSSLQDDIVLADFSLPADLLARFDGPRQGLQGLRRRAGADRQAAARRAVDRQAGAAAPSRAGRGSGHLGARAAAVGGQHHGGNSQGGQGG